jgi:hypothetical protein
MKRPTKRRASSADPTPAGERRKGQRSDRRDLQEAPLEPASFEDLPGKWQAAILEAEQNRPKLRIFSSD